MEQIKVLMTSSPILKYHNFNKALEVTCDRLIVIL